MLRVNNENDELPCMKRSTSSTATVILAVERFLKRIVRFTIFGIVNALFAISVILYRTSTRRISCASRYANGGIGGY